MKRMLLGIWLPVFAILLGLGLIYSSFPHGEYGGEGSVYLFFGAVVCATGAALWWHYGKGKLN